MNENITLLENNKENFDMKKFPVQAEIVKNEPMIEELSNFISKISKEKQIAFKYILDKQITIDNTKDKLNTLMS